MYLRTIVLFAAFAAGHCMSLSSVHADDPILATYFEVANDLVLNSLSRNALEISPAQNDSLRKLIEDPGILEKVGAQRRSIQRQFPQLDFETAWSMAQSRVDDVVRAELAKILLQQQLELAKPNYIRQQYPNGLAPFSDLELLSKCGVSAAEAELLKPKLEAATAKLIRSVNKLRTEASMRVLEALPDDSKRLFVSYAGNNYLPQLTAGDSLDIDALPYTEFVKPGGLMQVILSPEQNAKVLDLTEAQVDKIEAIQRIHQSSISGIARGSRSVSRLRDAVAEASSQNAKALESVLTKEQLLKLYRSRALDEFSSDLPMAFSRRKFLTYLHLNDEQTAEIRKKAFEAAQDMSRQNNEVQQHVFEATCGELAAGPRGVLLRLFDGVWLRNGSDQSQE